FTGLVSENDPEPYACEFLSGGHSLAAVTFDAAIRNAPRAAVALSRSYYIETIGADGRTEMVELMRQGATLPITREFEFATNPSNNYFAELRFFEERDFLKQITLTFAEPVAPGTTVKLSLSCNLQSKFSARAEVAGVVVDTQFEPSPPPPLPTHEEIDDVLRDARATIEQIPETGARIVAQQKLRRLAGELDAAMEEEDSGKARDKLNEVRPLAREAAVPKDMEPPRSAFEQLVARCEAANGESERGGPKVAEEINGAARAGRAAYGSANQAQLSQAVKELTAILQDLTVTEDSGHGGGGDERPPMWMLVLHFGPEVIAMIDAAEARTDLPAAFRRDHRADAAADRAALRTAMNACTPSLPMQLLSPDWMPDQEAAPHFGVVQRMYQKWDHIRNLVGTVAQKPGG
ncbi:MAG: hypothetical protein LPK92_00035, partial [Actinomycetes bacterium]|nr:hypothetical protein [Actinomycetes bacterium]